ncbi:hypothetical protein ACJIZ3_023680 [Penstemon smallii]|uniref:J domain-containing protein n=1 Tax=Penstemon smallii TaxID=265156 RepID=A0ABD3TPQ6_9LAMI
MECNKEEAIRSKAIAEKKFLSLDIEGAKKFALKAQTLFPKLDGIFQFLEVINIYVDNGKKINGEVDYYKMFGVDPFVDEDILKKQYKKLALSLHPDKNKSVGADGAFKIMSQAWSVLSDKDKRRTYNLKLNLNLKKGPNQRELSSAKPKTPSSANNTTSRKSNPPATNTSSHTPQKNSAKDPQKSRNRSPQKTPPKARSQARDPVRNPKKEASKSEIFWTSCNRCRIPYKYLKIYLNKNLRCNHCQQSFVAAEMTDPNVTHSSSPSGSNESLKAVNTEKKAEAVSAPNTHSSSLQKEKPNKKRRISEGEIRGNLKKTCANSR